MDDTGTIWKRMGYAVAFAATVSLVFGGLTPAAATETTSLENDVTGRDQETNELIPDTRPPGASDGKGYKLLQDLVNNSYAYTVRLIESPNVEKYRPILQTVVNELRMARLADLTIQAGTVSRAAKFETCKTGDPCHGRHRGRMFEGGERVRKLVG